MKDMKPKTKLKNAPPRCLPPAHKFVMTLETQRAYTILERLQLLIGYSTKTTMQIAMEHSPGKFDVLPVTIVTRDLLPKFTGEVVDTRVTPGEEPPF